MGRSSRRKKAVPTERTGAVPMAGRVTYGRVARVQDQSEADQSAALRLDHTAALEVERHPTLFVRGHCAMSWVVSARGRRRASLQKHEQCRPSRHVGLTGLKYIGTSMTIRKAIYRR